MTHDCRARDMGFFSVHSHQNCTVPYRHIHTWSPTIVGVQMMNLSQVFPKVAACFHSELSP
jgi:hypothetical protein